GFGTNKTESKSGTNTSENNSNFISLTYSNFLANNRRLNVGIASSKGEYFNNIFGVTNENSFYSATIGYGMLFPLLKNFYAEATPNFSYSDIN
ncbi:hypothetical protein U2242_15195, partial [Listeria monocytogenes]|uniref:hypothetical protein n=1 Tax=Listeria monocytogenes TaxID=1639 RepID=UPI002FDB9AEB